MFTTLTNWLRPAHRKARRASRLRTTLESLEDRTVPDANYYSLFNSPAPQIGTLFQDWSNTGLITSNNNWSGVPSFEAYNGNGLATSTGKDPRTITTTGGTLTVLANQNNPDTLAPGGVVEFEGNSGNDPVVALAGDSVNQAPYLVAYLDRAGTGDMEINATLRDIDGSSRNSISPIAVQYRASSTTNFTGIAFQNVTGAYVADASKGPGSTLDTNISGTIAASVLGNNRYVQVRFITADAVGDDEWIGIDKISIHGDLPPSLTITSTPLVYNEQVPYSSNPTPIAPSGSLSDADTAIFNNGSLTVSYTTAAAGSDQLLVFNQGTLPGQIGVSGTSVTYRPVASATPVVIGNITSNGTGTNPLVITFTNTGTADQTAIQALLQDICYVNTSSDPIPPGSSNPVGDPNVLPAAGVPQSPPTRDLTLHVVLDDGSGQTNEGGFPAAAAATRALQITANDNPPALALPGGPIVVQELDPAVQLDATATVDDPDSHDFDTGTLTVSFPTGATPDDILAVANQGMAPGQVSFDVLTSEITVNGQVIGSFTGGTAGTALIVTFNTASDPSTVQDVVRAITFQNTSLNPPVGSRAVRFVLTDGDGGSSGNVQVAVTITPVDNAPTITLTAPTPPALLPSVSYTENDPPIILDAGATIADPDSLDFNTGALTISFAANGLDEDQLTINNQGTGAFQIGYTGGATVTYNPGTGPVAIGSITSSGIGDSPLQITLTPAATVPAVQALLQNIAYVNNSDNPSTLVRTVQFVVSDGDGEDSAPAQMLVNVVPVNDGPVISNLDGTTVNYSAGLPAVLLATPASILDVDSANLQPGSMTVTIASGGLTADTLAIRNQGTGAGKIGVNGSNVLFGGIPFGTFSGGSNGNPLVISFTAPTTSATVQALAQAITFKTPNGAAVIGDRVVTVSVTDDLGAASTLVINGPAQPAAITVHVTSTAAPDDDFFETSEDVPLSVASASGVLINDPGFGADAITASTTPIAGPANGTLALQADGSFLYTPNANWNGTDTFTYQWNDATASTSGTAIVTITVDPVNDPPVVQLGATPIVLNEDAGPQSFPGFAVTGPGGGPDEASQTLTKTITNDNNGLFSNQPAIDANGRLSFTPAPNANGTANVTFKVQDDGGTFGNPLDQDTTTQTFQIIINAVNDQPTFQLIGNPPTVNEDAGPQTVSGFAFNFSPGPPSAIDEQSQTATYILTPIGNTGPQSPGGKLEFTSGPIVSASGDLTYTPAPNSNGTATYLIQVNDGGGTANGGIDTSTPRTFTITVTPVNDPPTVGNDTVTVNWNTGANPIDVLANDSGDPDVGETVTVTGFTQGAHGAVVLQPGGTGVTYQPNPAYVGSDSFQYTASDGHGGTAVGTVSVNVIQADVQSVDTTSIGSGPGGDTQVRIYNTKTGQFVAGFQAFDPGFKGGISVATGDVNGDGVADIIVSAGFGGGPRIEIIDGTKLGILQGTNQIAAPSAIIANFFAYDLNFRGGVTVAAGDVNGDGKADIIVGSGNGGGPNVKVISGALVNRTGPDRLIDDSALLASFFAYDSNFRGGVNVAAGDVNGDRFADVITGAGVGGSANVKAFDGLKLVQSGPNANGVVLASFFAFDSSFRGGVSVSAGDLDGDGLADFIAGAGAGGGPNVRVYSPLNLATPIASFFAVDPTFSGGVDVGFIARSGGLSPLLLTGTGTGTDARLIAFAPPSYTVVQNIDPFDPGFMGGISVG